MIMREALGPILFAMICAPGCGGDCTEQGCEPRAELRLPVRIADFSAIEVRADNMMLQCTIRSERDVSCDDGLALTFTDDGSSRVSAPASTFNTLIVQGTPTQIRLSFMAQDASTKEVEIKPNYESVEVNGKGCGECAIATQTVVLD